MNAGMNKYEYCEFTSVLSMNIVAMNNILSELCPDERGFL